MENLTLKVQGLDSVLAECVCIIAEILNQKDTTSQEYLFFYSLYCSIESGLLNAKPAFVFSQLLAYKNNKNRELRILIQNLCTEN